MYIISAGTTKPILNYFNFLSMTSKFYFTNIKKEIG